jgi:hypothetical protein
VGGGVFVASGVGVCGGVGEYVGVLVFVGVFVGDSPPTTPQPVSRVNPADERISVEASRAARRGTRPV